MYITNISCRIKTWFVNWGCLKKYEAEMSENITGLKMNDLSWIDDVH